MRHPDLHTYFDPRSGESYVVNVRTNIVCGRDGEYPSDEVAARVLKVVRARIVSQADRKVRDSISRDHGLVKVRGNLGRTYWE